MFQPYQPHHKSRNGFNNFYLTTKVTQIKIKTGTAVTPKHEHETLQFFIGIYVVFGGPPCLLGHVNSLNVNGLEYLPIYILMAGLSKTSSGNACLCFDEFAEISNIWHAIQILDVCGN